MRRPFVLIATAILAVVLMGCGPADDVPESRRTYPQVTNVTGIDSWADFYDTEINGVRCIVFSGYKSGGISCDFAEASR